MEGVENENENDVSNEGVNLNETDTNEEQARRSDLTLEWGKLAVIFLCGRMGCGKSTAIQEIVRNSTENKVHDWVVAFTPTQYTGEFSYLPSSAIFEFGDGTKLLKMYNQIQQYKKRCAAKNKTEARAGFASSPIAWAVTQN